MPPRKPLVLALVATAFAMLAPAAHATFHLTKIREVGRGGTGAGDYVELQMYAPGQTLLAGKFITSYDSSGAVQSSFMFPGDVTFGDSQRTIYVSRNEGTPPVTPDFSTPDLVLTNDGAACFGALFGPGQAIDCVSYGAFAGVAGGDPSPMGTPAPALAPGQAIERSIAAGCATLLEAGDDTDDSATDFAISPQDPRNNATAPTETPCNDGGGGGDTTAPQTTITKAPKRRSTKRKVRIAFSSDERGSRFRCSLDGARFADCDSPFSSRVKVGRHAFAVFAIDNAGNEDPSPAKVKFRRVAAG